MPKLRAIVGTLGLARARRSNQTITLQPERILRGRFIDLQGQPIAAVSLRVRQYNWLPYETAGEAPAWPGPVTTDGQGRFALRGTGPNGAIVLEATSDGHARQMFRIDPEDEAWAHETAFALSPAQVIEVRVTRADDGKPVPGAWVNVFAPPRRREARPVRVPETNARTDERGFVRITPALGESFWITASAPASVPYLNQRVTLNWPKGAVRQAVELKLKRGVPVHGTITEEPSGKPVAGALVTYNLTRRADRLYRDFQSLPMRGSDHRRWPFPDRGSPRPRSSLGPGGDPRLSARYHVRPGAGDRPSAQPVAVPRCAGSYRSQAGRNLARGHDAAPAWGYRRRAQ